ncbi:MAG TPA: ROK family protein [Pseudonocardia sp.]
MGASESGGAAVVVGIDIGGTGTRFVAAAGTQVLARRTAATPHTAGPDDIRAFLAEHIGEVTAGLQPVATGIAASGPIDASGVIRNPDTLPAFTGIPLVAIVGELVPGPVAVENDAVCAALAERAVGAAATSRRSLHITLGTGVGVCLLDGDVPFRLADGAHPEGGHFTVATPTERCYCGRRPCWEQAASRRSLQHTAARILDRSPAEEHVIADLADHARRGDEAACAAFADYGRAVADGLATLLALYGPELAIIGGSAARYLALYERSMSEAIAALGGWVPPHRVIRTRLDDYGGAIGGARLAVAAIAAS